MTYWFEVTEGLYVFGNIAQITYGFLLLWYSKRRCAIMRYINLHLHYITLQ